MGEPGQGNITRPVQGGMTRLREGMSGPSCTRGSGIDNSSSGPGGMVLSIASCHGMSRSFGGMYLPMGGGEYGIRGSAPGIIIPMMTPPTGAPQGHFVSIMGEETTEKSISSFIPNLTKPSDKTSAHSELRELRFFLDIEKRSSRKSPVGVLHMKLMEGLERMWPLRTDMLSKLLSPYGATVCGMWCNRLPSSSFNTWPSGVPCTGEENIDFESLVQIEAVTIGRCKEVESLAAAKAFQEAKNALQPSSCGSSANLMHEDGALNFGCSEDSFGAIPLKKRGNLKGGINVTLQFRTYQSDGLIFYLPV
ncbi:hypothetical protein QYM36_005804 [Artemia franciscana]|uniref:Uncharacterized protein n=1 Tax=Artemia franciscana TaxID=6661 RepID=A0AA88LA45_ARTSF|nr:hypothetical protein QYM36_005804 [Artemia franciscana]